MCYTPRIIHLVLIIYLFSDSLYMALSAESIEAVIKPELRDEFKAVKSQWFPRTDTADNAAFDTRTPGEQH